jgi:hypothetical protein
MGGTTAAVKAKDLSLAKAGQKRIRVMLDGMWNAKTDYEA